MFFKKKYTPSVKANNQLKEKAINELTAFIYSVEKGHFDTEADKDAVMHIVAELSEDTKALANTVGTGNEPIDGIANNILDLLKDFKKITEQDMLHRIQEVVDDLDFYVNLWRDVLNGDTVVPTEEESAQIKMRYTRRKLAARLEELKEMEERFGDSSRRVGKEITAIEKDIAELEASLAKEEGERKISELYKNITAEKTKLDSLNVRRSNYITCYNMLDTIYLNASEILDASDFVGEQIRKAKILLNMGKLKKVITKPEKAVHIIERMYKDIKATNEKTKISDAKIAAVQTDSIKASDDALAYKEALNNKNN
ncbi:MAG: hypothetical protein J6D20_02230 [Clostridia bacterium]|nr:hypothetical protein [Clostridia bacterium]